MARNIVPRTDKGADLGTSAKNWGTVYAGQVIADTVQGGNLGAVEQSAGDEVALRSLIASSGSNPLSITVYNDIPITTTDLTIPSNIHLNFKDDGGLSPATDITLTILGRISAGLWQIFSGSGSVELYNQIAVFPEWFGAIGDGVTDDSNALYKSCKSPHVILTNKYKIRDVLVESDVEIIGLDGSELQAIETTYGVSQRMIYTEDVNDVNQVVFRNVVFNGGSTSGYDSSNDPRIPMIHIKYIDTAKFIDCEIFGMAIGTGSTLPDDLRERTNSHVLLHEVNHSIVMGLVIHDSRGGEQFRINPSSGGDFLIEDCHSYNNMTGASPFGVFHGRGIFRNNVIEGSVTSAINLFVYDSIIEGNRISGVTNSNAIDLCESASFYRGFNNIIRNNIIDDIENVGINVAGSNIIIENNVLTNVRHRAIHCGSSVDNTYQANWSADIWTELGIGSSHIDHNIVIHSNVIQNCKSKTGGKGSGIIDVAASYALNIEETAYKSKLSHVNISDNIIDNTGYDGTDMSAIFLCVVDDVNVEGNIIKNWDSATNSNQAAIQIICSASNINITNNEIDGPQSRTRQCYTILTTSKELNEMVFENITIKNNVTTPELATIDSSGKIFIFAFTGRAEIKGNINMPFDGTTVKLIGKTIGVHQELFAESYYLQMVLDVGDIIFDIIPSASGKIGKVCTSKGGVTRYARSNSSTVSAFNVYKYSDGSCWFCHETGTTASSEPNISTTSVGAQITDGTAVLEKISEDTAVLKLFGAIDA
jgi:hypothetical protein